MISECSKPAQKTKHDWVGKGIHWELCKRVKFVYTTKWYIHKPESILVKEILKIIRDFVIQTDHQISARLPDLIIVNKKKKTCQPADFALGAIGRILKWLLSGMEV